MLLESSPNMSGALTIEEAGCLVAEKFIIPVQGGKRKVSAALLGPPSSSGSQSSGSQNSASSASLNYQLFNASAKDPFDLPETLESVTTYEQVNWFQK